MRQRLWTTRSWIFVTCNVSPISPISSRAFFLLDFFRRRQGKDFQEALQSSQRASELLGQPLLDEPWQKDGPTLADGIFPQKTLMLMLPSENVLRKRKICCSLALATRRQMQQDHEMRALLMVHLFELSWKVPIGIVNVPSVIWEHLLTHWFGRHWHWHSLEALKKPRIFWRRGDCKVRSYSNPCEPSCWIDSCSLSLLFVVCLRFCRVFEVWGEAAQLPKKQRKAWGRPSVRALKTIS